MPIGEFVLVSVLVGGREDNVASPHRLVEIELVFEFGDTVGLWWEQK